MRSRHDVSLPYELAGSSDAVRDCLAQVERAAADDRNVIVIAERGLDAEAVARVLHERSDRAERPFVLLHCEGTGGAELERALLGTSTSRGRDDVETVAASSALVRARGGVLFLTQINELPAALQRRLARVLRDQEVRVARSPATTVLRVRVIASLEGSPDGSLREDLLRRLPIVVDVPPLRRRRDDIASIAAGMLAARSTTHRFTPAALTVLSALPWRRNLSELSRLVHRLSTAPDPVIRQEEVLAEVQLEPAPPRARVNLREARRQFEKDYIASVLREHAWQMRAAARALGIERANLYRKARQLGIPLRRTEDVVRRVGS